MQYICEYNQEWPEHFRAIVRYLVNFLPGECSIHHVGSTAVPGMSAKDIIDLDIECPKGTMPLIIKALEEAGYEHQGDKGIPTREAFRPLELSPSFQLPPHHLYACESDSPELFKHIAFREYLKAHKTRVEWLAAEKLNADTHAESRAEYVELKSDAYTQLTEESLQWARQLMSQSADKPNANDESNVSDEPNVSVDLIG